MWHRELHGARAASHAKSVDGAPTFYSLGVILYELADGRAAHRPVQAAVAAHCGLDRRIDEVVAQASRPSSRTSHQGGGVIAKALEPLSRRRQRDSRSSRVFACDAVVGAVLTRASVLSRSNARRCGRRRRAGAHVFSRSGVEVLASRTTKITRVGTSPSRSRLRGRRHRGEVFSSAKAGETV